MSPAPAPTAIRTGTPSDLDALLTLIHSAYRGESGRVGWTTESDLIAGSRTTAELLAADLARPAVTFLVAPGPDGLLGCAAVTVAGERAEFGTFAVRPDRQRGGLGSALLLAAADHARAAGATTMELSVIAPRAELLAWYERRGFVRTGERRPFPYGDDRYGRPRRDDLEFVVLARGLRAVTPRSTPSTGDPPACEGGAVPDLTLAQDPDADAVLSANPFALVVGMLLDQQFPMERAFAAPALLAARIGALSPQAVADYDTEALVAAFVGPPALHRYPRSMAERTQAVARAVVQEWDGDTERLWSRAGSGKEVLANLRSLPGFGARKAQIFTALLGKQCGVRPDGWRAAAGAFGEQGARRSIADVTDAATLGEVREFKQAEKKAAKG